MGEIDFDLPPVNRHNLSLLSKEESIISERRICELSELADLFVRFSAELLSEGFGILEILSFISEEFKLSENNIHEAAMQENRHRLEMCEALTSLSDRAVFAELLTDRMNSFGIKVTEGSFLPDGNSAERFTYVKNPYSDEAYDVFSQDFSDPRLKYSATFKDAVRDVLEGESSYALLPLEEAGGTRLPTVAELIYRNDLKINAVTPVFGPDGSSELKFALLSEGLTPPPLRADDDRYLEIRISAHSPSVLTGAVLAAEMYGAQIYRINTAFFTSDGRQDKFYTVVFHADGYDFTKLFVYLTLFTDDFTPVGMYKNFE